MELCNDEDFNIRIIALHGLHFIMHTLTADVIQL